MSLLFMISWRIGDSPLTAHPTSYSSLVYITNNYLNLIFSPNKRKTSAHVDSCVCTFLMQTSFIPMFFIVRVMWYPSYLIGFISRYPKDLYSSIPLSFILMAALTSLSNTLPHCGQIHFRLSICKFVFMKPQI